jgi:hypothetical protein
MFATDSMPEGAQQIAWQPLPGSQALAIACPAHVILYEGTRGPGKTDCQLMAFRKNVGLGYGRFWRGVIFDREYKNLDDLVSKSLRWFPSIAGPKPRFLSSTSDYKWVWETGEELLFRQVKRDADYWNYHGQEFPFIGWNELAKYAMPTLFDAMFSCNRSSFRPEDFPIIVPGDPKPRYLPEIPLVCFATTNPYGPGHNWVKDRFIDAAEPGQLIRKHYNVFNPRTQMRQDLVKYHVRIFGSYKENIYLSPEYVAELESIRDINKRKAWLWGDWDIVAGGAFDDVWNAVVHKPPRFKVPHSWRVDRSFDWGSTHPFSVGWWAEANGEECVLPDGSTWCPPPGTLIRIHEWYGSSGEANEGLKLSAKAIARGIREREDALLEQGWISERPAPGPADNQIRNVTERDTDTIEKMMADEGIHWESSDKSPGSRKVGLQLARDRFEASVDGVGPGIYCMEHCRAFLKYIPTLPRDEKDMDDVDTDAEDHIWDETRYRVLAGNNRIATDIPTTIVR